MSIYHIVCITSAGYRRIHSFEAAGIVRAAKAALDAKWRRSFGSIVLREGDTGARFSMYECALIARQQVSA